LQYRMSDDEEYVPSEEEDVQPKRAKKRDGGSGKAGTRNARGAELVQMERGNPIDLFNHPRDQKTAIIQKKMNTLDEFKMYFNFSYPAIQVPRFSSRSKYDVSNYDSLRGEYNKGAEAMIKYYLTTVGRPRSTKNDPIVNMRTNIPIKDWILFVGLEADDLESILGRKNNFEHINYTDLEKILSYIENLLPFQRQEMLDKRYLQRLKLFQDRPTGYVCQYKDGNGITWYVRRDVDLPWQIPMYSNFFNSKAVSPEWATAEEMIIQGRMYEGNQKVYHGRESTLHSFYMQLRRISDKIVPKEISRVGHLLSYIQMFSYGSEFDFCKPYNDLRIIHTNHLGYCLFLFFPKSEVTRELDKYWIPYGKFICEFNGEIRPLDMSVPSHVEMQYNKPRGNTSIVVTNKYDGQTRPGVGSCAFFVNSTCHFHDADVNFTCSESHIWTSNSPVIKEQSFLEKFISINARRNITGAEIKKWNDDHRPLFLSWFNSNCISEDQLIFPVEFLYHKNEGAADPVVGNTMCQCLTSCSGRLPEFRGRINLFNDALIARSMSDPWKTIEDHRKLSNAMVFQNQMYDHFWNYLKQYPPMDVEYRRRYASK